MLLKYRADIDGLRAIAVLAVIFYHAGIPGFSGGFVGVDVFFVISGFLITSIILKEISAGNFSVTRFYERRIKRIFPALFPVIAFTLIVGAFLFDYSAFKALGGSITATTLFASNILFWKQTGYFDAASFQKPLLHTWSLAVEEQFYIIFPFLLLAIKRFGKKQYLPWLLGIGIISFIISIYGVYFHQEATFYLVPTRAWELLAGAILALGSIPLVKSNIKRNLFSVIGIGLIFYSALFYNDKTLFPGANAFAPVLGASLIIYTGINDESIISKFLSIKPLVYIGLISYSLYLWHWPLITFTKYMLFKELTHFEVTGIILVTFIISAFSLKFIEKPFRGKQSIIPDRNKLFALSAMVMFITSFIGGIIYLQNGMPYRYPEANAVILDINNDHEWLVAGENENITVKLNNGKKCPLIGTTNTIPCFILWGDSHARALIPAISSQANRNGLSGFIATQSSHPPILGIDGIESNMNVFCHHAYNDGVISFIRSHPEIRTVILTAQWESYANGYNHNYIQLGENTFKLKDATGVFPEYSNAALLKIGLTRTVKTLLGLGRQVVLLSDVPDIGYDVVRLYWINSIIGENYNNLLPSMNVYHERDKYVYDMLSALVFSPNVIIIYPESMLVDKSGKIIIQFKDKLLYRDSHHLSKYGAMYLSVIFDDLFKKMSSTYRVMYSR
jgi:peptidoglycan/LPS O-acetylase OafA/YrhL